MFRRAKVLLCIVLLSIAWDVAAYGQEPLPGEGP